MTSVSGNGDTGVVASKKRIRYDRDNMSDTGSVQELTRIINDFAEYLPQEIIDDSLCMDLQKISLNVQELVSDIQEVYMRYDDYRLKNRCLQVKVDELEHKLQEQQDQIKRLLQDQIQAESRQLTAPGQLQATNQLENSSQPNLVQISEEVIQLRKSLQAKDDQLEAMRLKQLQLQQVHNKTILQLKDELAAQKLVNQLHRSQVAEQKLDGSQAQFEAGVRQLQSGRGFSEEQLKKQLAELTQLCVDKNQTIQVKDLELMQAKRQMCEVKQQYEQQLIKDRYTQFLLLEKAVCFARKLFDKKAEFKKHIPSLIQTQDQKEQVSVQAFQLQAQTSTQYEHREQSCQTTDLQNSQYVPSETKLQCTTDKQAQEIIKELRDKCDSLILKQQSDEKEKQSSIVELGLTKEDLESAKKDIQTLQSTINNLKQVGSEKDAVILDMKHAQELQHQQTVSQKYGHQTMQTMRDLVAFAREQQQYIMQLSMALTEGCATNIEAYNKRLQAAYALSEYQSVRLAQIVDKLNKTVDHKQADVPMNIKKLTGNKIPDTQDPQANEIQILLKRLQNQAELVELADKQRKAADLLNKQVTQENEKKIKQLTAQVQELKRQLSAARGSSNSRNVR